jgi:predicted dienelactone hydrolase
VSTIKVRSLYSSAKVAGAQSPYDSLTLKIYYPCRFTDSVEERSTGLVPADSSRAPFPVVILLPGEDVTHESYAWLATELARAGSAVVSYSWVCKDEDGVVRLNPGVHRKRVSSKRYGKKPSCPALAPLFSELKKQNRSGILANQLDLSRVVLGGHGLGGRMALLNANRDWFPALCGVFAYGAHTLGDPKQGWDKKAVMPLQTDMPMLLMAGTEDGLLEAETAYIAGKNAGPTWAAERSFDLGIKGKRGDRHLVLVDGGRHYSIASPRDPSIGRQFLDHRGRGRGKAVRKFLAQLLATFCDQSCRGDPMTTADLNALCDGSHPMVARAAHK